MITGFKAAQNPRHRKRDIRDSIDHLTVDLYAETERDREVLAIVRRQLSAALRDDLKVSGIDITTTKA